MGQNHPKEGFLIELIFLMFILFINPFLKES